MAASSIIKSGTKTEPWRRRLAKMDKEFDRVKPVYQDIVRYVAPFHGRFLPKARDEKENFGRIKMDKILKTTPLQFLDTFARGLLAGTCSASRPWFALKLPDDQLMEYDPVKRWVDIVTAIMFDIFTRSNFYDSSASVTKEMVIFGTGGIVIDEDFKQVIRCIPLTAGQYRIGLDEYFKPNRMMRRFAFDAFQLRARFGDKNLSDKVKRAISKNDSETQFDIIQAIEPNEFFDGVNKGGSKKAFRSVYFEEDGDPDVILREGGYRIQNFAPPRFESIADMSWGVCPTWIELADIKMLYTMVDENLDALARTNRPPLNVPNSLKNEGVNIAPGAQNFVDATQGNPGITAMYQINPQIALMWQQITALETDIRRGYYNDMFLAIIGQDKSMTAYEVAKRNEEKLMMLGPVMEKIQNEFLRPVIDRVFDIAMNFGLFPPAPQEIAGMELQVEYVGLLAQAQKLVGISGIEQMVQLVGSLAQINPQAVDKLNVDEVIDKYAIALNLPQGVVNSDDTASQIRQQRQQMQNMQMMAANAKPVADAAKAASETEVGEGGASVLDNLISAAKAK